MTMTIGRCALNENPYDFDFDGNVWSFAIDIVPTVAADINEMKARRQQLSGLANNADEPAIPVTWSEDSTFDGYYRVLGVSVPSIPAMLTTGWIQGCQISLERLTGYSNALLESTVSAVVRTNASGIGTYSVVPFLMSSSAAGNETDLRQGGVTLGSTSVYARSTEDSASMWVWTITAPLALTSVRQSVLPSQTYNGGARIEIKYGSTWYQVIGRDIPRYTTPWRISNGYVRLTSQDGATSGTIEIWNGAAWESQDVCHYHNNSNAFGVGRTDYNSAGVTSLTVLRNSPEQVTVKVSETSSDMTYSIQRGTSHATVIYSAGTAAYKMGIGFTSTNACTAITGGLRRTANDANGNRLVFSIAAAFTSDAVNGRVAPTTAATQVAMAVGVELDGTAAVTPNDGTQIVKQFLAQASIRQRVVRR